MKRNWSTKIKLNASGVAVMNKKPGMYRLLYLNPNTKRYNQFFTGETNNLKDELALHLPWREQDYKLSRYLKKYSCYFQVVEMDTQSNSQEQQKQGRGISRLFRILAGSPIQSISYR
jgi:hypothetical protein